MPRSTTSIVTTFNDPNHATPYIYLHNQLKVMEFNNMAEIQPVGPAGAVVSTARDMASWLLVQTSSGKIGDHELISANNLAEMHKPHIFIDDTQGRLRFGFEFSSYGLGWFIHSHKGEVLLEHGGNIDGFSSLVSFLPRHDLGVVVLSNGEGVNNNIPETISYTIYDRLLGLKPTDWNKKYKELNDEILKAMDQSKQQSGEEKRAAPPSHPLEDYLGEYEHPGYGTYAVQRNEGKLEMVANDKMVLTMEHYHYDIFLAKIEKFDSEAQISFHTDNKGNIAGFFVQLEDMVKEIYFTKLADKRLNDPAYLAQFTGEYEVLELALMVFLKEGKLCASLPGQEFELVPYQGTEFQFKGRPGLSLAFKPDKDGHYNEATFAQPGAVFTAKRKIRG